MTIKVNGDNKTTQAQTISELLSELGATGKPVLVELNKTALSASAHTTTHISDGDSIELFFLGAGG